MKKTEYELFLEKKQKNVTLSGFDIDESELNDKLFPFQKFCVKRALKAGKYGLFEDCGLGKTAQQLEWAKHVNIKTKKPVLILCPLAVAGQTINEGVKFNVPVKKYDGSNFHVQITNYDQLDNVDVSIFGGIVLDESSILKNFEGATKNLIIEKFKDTPYKLACTATPSPNDPMELGNHSEFLDVMSRNEMLAMYFVHDGGETAKWRLKGHAIKLFYQFIGTWAIMLNNPGDIGFKMDGYELPSLNILEHQIKTQKRDNGQLFNDAIISATNFNQELRLTLNERLQKAADLALEKSKNGEDVIIWIKQNIEGDILRKLIPNSKEISGELSNELKELLSLWFTNNECICNTRETKKNIENSTTENGTKKIKSQKIKEQQNYNELKENQIQNGMSVKKSIIENGILKTKKEQNNIMQKILKEEENGSVINIKMIQSSESEQKDKLKKHQNGILKPELETYSKNYTESHLRNTMNCSISKIINVPFAVQNPPLLQPNKDFMLTTVTKQEKSEGCCVLTAIKESENLKTISDYSKKQLCTCGANKKGKVIISKTKILGYGINMQNCNNQIFASLDFSF